MDRVSSDMEFLISNKISCFAAYFFGWNTLFVTRNVLLHFGRCKLITIHCSLCWPKYTISGIMPIAEFILECKMCFHHYLTCAFPFWRVMSIYPIDQYQNAIPRAMPLQVLKKSSTSRAHGIGFYRSSKIMSVLLLSGGVEYEWKCYSSWHSVEKMLAF